MFARALLRYQIAQTLDVSEFAPNKLVSHTYTHTKIIKQINKNACEYFFKTRI